MITVQVDSREKPKMTASIIKHFEEKGVNHITSKMYVGDYCTLQNPLLIIDRKQNIAEIAQNATSGHERFKRELVRLDEMGGKMIILVQQTKYKSKNGQKQVKELKDIMFWQPKHGCINGLQVYKILSAWENKHNIEFQFCNKSQTGEKIIEILGVN